MHSLKRGAGGDRSYPSSIAYNANSATWHATERSRLVNIGKTPPFADGQIAAIAKVNDLILVTNNMSDYADFLDLQVENCYT